MRIEVMNKAVFLDRDGTINIDVGYLDDPDELVFIKGAKEAIYALKKEGFLVFIITNQSGIARGYFTLETLNAINKKLLEEFKKEGINIDGICYCPHHPEDKCRCRKPSPEMVKKISRKFKVNLEKSYFAGDKISDVQTGRNAGCKTILIESDGDSILEEDDTFSQPDFIAKNLKEAAKWIIKDSRIKVR